MSLRIIFLILLKLFVLNATGQINGLKLYFCEEIDNLSPDGFIQPGNDIKCSFKLIDSGNNNFAIHKTNFLLKNWCTYTLSKRMLNNTIEDRMSLLKKITELKLDSFKSNQLLFLSKKYTRLKNLWTKYRYITVLDSMLFVSIRHFGEKERSIFINLKNGEEINFIDYLDTNKITAFYRFFSEALKSNDSPHELNNINLFPEIVVFDSIDAKYLDEELYFDIINSNSDCERNDWLHYVYGFSHSVISYKKVSDFLYKENPFYNLKNTLF